MHPKVLIPLLDLTSLNDSDNRDTIKVLCRHANTVYGPVATVCVHAHLVKCAKQALGTSPVKVTTVLNFPHGDAATEGLRSEVAVMVADHADEIDMVVPLADLQAQQFDTTTQAVSAIKSLMGQRPLKVILETGVLEPAQIEAASEAAIAGGADFLKTSTGKVAVGATLSAAEIMLRVIAQHYQKTGRWVGFKASGGVRTYEQALNYINLARTICGDGYIQQATFRFGASGLLGSILEQI